MSPSNTAPAANNLEAFFMPFTANRQFKKNPRMFVAAKDMHYSTSDGRQVLGPALTSFDLSFHSGTQPLIAAESLSLIDACAIASSLQTAGPHPEILSSRCVRAAIAILSLPRNHFTPEQSHRRCAGWCRRQLVRFECRANPSRY